MKKTNHLIFLAAVSLIFASAVPSKAQYKPVGDDGIAASPKLRQMLNERATRLAVTSQSTSRVVGYKPLGDDGITASPKLREILNERAARLTATSESGSRVVGYKPVGKDGITASPKLRELLDERAGTIQIAPLK